MNTTDTRLFRAFLSRPSHSSAFRFGPSRIAAPKFSRTKAGSFIPSDSGRSESSAVGSAKAEAFSPPTLRPSAFIPQPSAFIPSAFSPRAAFTLIELMAVLVIVGILIALAFGISGYAAQAARKGKARAQLQEIGGVLQDHMSRTGVCPDNLYAVTNRLPVSFRFDLTGAPLDPWNHPYVYVTNSAYSFRLYSCGPDGTNGTASDDIELGK